jgi:RNA polymerase sigma factor, sigma-70 family
MLDTLNIQELRNRNVDAFKVLFRDMFHHVRVYAEDIVKDKFEAEDVTSHAFAKCWELIDKFESLDALRKFLYTTAKNMGIDYLRKKKAQQNYLNDPSVFNSLPLTLPAHIVNTENVMFETLFAELLQHVQTLSPQVRKVFILHHIQKIPCEQVAEKLEIRPATVRSHLRVAKNKLRLLFNERDYALISLLLFGYC